jgi:thiamine-phosphate pyrophosphorylase
MGEMNGGNPRLCLVVETASRDGPEQARIASVEAVLESTPAATLIVAPRPGFHLDARSAAPLVELAQKSGLAALIQDDAQLALALKADGVHLTSAEDVIGAFAAARARLGPSMIAGADAGRSRHDAMTLGEQGADYVAFGIPPHVADREAAIATRLELVEWWAEVFEIPVVAFGVETEEEASQLASAGADFVAVTMPAGMTPEMARGWGLSLAGALAPSATVA